MSWLIPVVFLSFGFGQLFKWSQRKRHNAPVVITTNYLVLAGCLFGYFVLSSDLSFSWQVLQVGTITGLFFIASMLTMTYALTRIDSAPTLTSFRLAVVVPIFAGAFLWDEFVTARQVAGFAAALASLFLLTWRTDGESKGNKMYLVSMIFILQGLSMCCLHWVHHAGLDEQRLHVLMVTAATAGILGGLFVLLRSIPLRADALRAGAGIGIFNLLALSVSLTALAQIQGTIFFPINGCGVVLLDNLFAHFAWKEPLGRVGFFGAALGGLAMVLII
ncbi:MAG: hypothetical protein CME28_00565 [Gemmatimonadetes bacterium]|nr:hypothetical protein [Gemmatimonadota bacterium]